MVALARSVECDLHGTISLDAKCEEERQGYPEKLRQHNEQENKGDEGDEGINPVLS